MSRNPGIVALLFLLLIAIAPASAGAEDEGQVVYIFTPSETDDNYLRQKEMLGNVVGRSGLTIFTVIGEDTVLVNNVPVTGISADYLRREYDVPLYLFKIFLMGENGKRWESGKPVDLGALFPSMEDIPWWRREQRRRWW